MPKKWSICAREFGSVKHWGEEESQEVVEVRKPVVTVPFRPAVVVGQDIVEPPFCGDALGVFAGEWHVGRDEHCGVDSVGMSAGERERPRPTL